MYGFTRLCRAAASTAFVLFVCLRTVTPAGAQPQPSVDEASRGQLTALASPTLGAGQTQSAGKMLQLGAGDQLRIFVFQNPELTLDARVDGNGQITYPFIGAVSIEGRTIAQVEQAIASGLEERNVLKRPQVSVVLTSFRSQQVSVLGYVNRPGQFALDLPLTVSSAIAMAGGANPGAADAAVLSRLEGRELVNIEIDLVQMFRPGSSRTQDVSLLPGDVVFVHRAPVIYIYGEVQRPGMQRLERDMTVMQALSAGGGLTQRGTERRTRVTRRNAAGESTSFDVEPQTRLQADDVLYVRESMF